MLWCAPWKDGGKGSPAYCCVLFFREWFLSWGEKNGGSVCRGSGRDFLLEKFSQLRRKIQFVRPRPFQSDLSNLLDWLGAFPVFLAFPAASKTANRAARLASPRDRGTAAGSKSHSRELCLWNCGRARFPSLLLSFAKWLVRMMKTHWSHNFGFVYLHVAVIPVKIDYESLIGAGMIYVYGGAFLSNFK